MLEKQEFLKQNGIDIDSALEYMGDFDTFNEILNDFYEGLDNQLQELENAKNASDLTNYAILVHALKSNCRSLGITNFASIAYNHEMESKAGNIDFVRAHFSDLVIAKDNCKDLISKYFSL